MGSIGDGTVSFFCDEIFDGDCTEDTFYKTTSFSTRSTEQLQAVEDNENGIGIISYAQYTRYEDTLYAVPLDKDTDGDYVIPSANTIANENYPLTRPLYINVRKDLENDKDLQNLLYFGFNTQFGQLILEDVLGYTPLNNQLLQNQIDRIPGNQLYFAAGTNCHYIPPINTSDPNYDPNSNSNHTNIYKDENYDDEFDGLLAGIIIVFVILSVFFCLLFCYVRNKIMGDRVGFETPGNQKQTSTKNGVQMTRVEQDESEDSR